MADRTLPGHDPITDLAVETLRGFERAREEAPAYRGPAWDRFLARLIDAGILAALTGFAILLWLTATASSRDRDEGPDVGRAPANGVSGAMDGPTIRWGPTAPSWEGIVVVVGAAGVLVGYDLATTLIGGATPGKRIMGLRVVDAAGATDRKPASVPRLLARSALLALPLSFGLLMWFASMFYAWVSVALVLTMFGWLRRESATPQTLYDRWAGTQVVSADAGRRVAIAQRRDPA